MRAVFAVLGSTVAVAGGSITITTSMTNQPTAGAQICSVCREPVTGSFEVHEYRRKGVPQIVIESTSDRNFNVCDSCNDVICYRCSEHPDSGYCNHCYRLASVTISGEEPPTATALDKHLDKIDVPQTNTNEPKNDQPGATTTTPADRVRLVQKLLKHRTVDVADIQGRIASLANDLNEIANDFEGYMSDIDCAIMDVLNAQTPSDAIEAAEQFDTTN
jgi:hypothetical protein